MDPSGTACATGWCAPPPERPSSEGLEDQPFRQVLMKALRSAPLTALAVASALQVFILFCWVGAAAAAAVAGAAAGAAAAALLPLRQVFMKALRSSPFSAFVFASALHVFILFCWVVIGAFSVAAGAAMGAAATGLAASAGFAVAAAAMGFAAEAAGAAVCAMAMVMAPVNARSVNSFFMMNPSRR